MTTYGEFEAAMAEGADCDRLFALRADLPVQDKEHATVQLQRIGCYAASSTRTDSIRDRERYRVADYQDSYRSVIAHPEQLYTDARTQNAQEAAGSYARRFDGTAVHAAYVAALDALQGRPPRH